MKCFIDEQSLCSKRHRESAAGAKLYATISALKVLETLDFENLVHISNAKACVEVIIGRLDDLPWGLREDVRIVCTKLHLHKYK